MLFSLVYLVLYPGLGSFKGVLGWTQVGQLEAENARVEAKFGPLYAKFAAQDVPTLAEERGGDGDRTEAFPQPLRAVPCLGRRRLARFPEPDRQGLALGRNAGGDQDLDHRGSRPA